MLFNIEYDGGDRIIGYVVPDGYTGEAKLKICANDRILLETTTAEDRPALVAAGRHQTGKCGFTLDSTVLSGIDGVSDLEIYEESNNILIYRRPRANFIQKKVLRIDTHLFPFQKFDTAIRRFFQYHMVRIERFGKETIDQFFLLNAVNSIFLSGRIMYKNYQNYIEGQFSTFIVLQDPYEELAERLLIMKILGQSEHKLLGEREEIFFAPVIAYVSDLSTQDPVALKRSIINMPRNLVTILSNPVVRQLTASASDEMPQRLSVASALDVLSSCELIGFRQHPGLISKEAAELLNLAPSSIDIHTQFSAVQQLGALLKDVGVAESFLERDIELYQAAFEAVNAAGQRLERIDDNG